MESTSRDAPTTRQPKAITADADGPADPAWLALALWTLPAPTLRLIGQRSVAENSNTWVEKLLDHLCGKLRTAPVGRQAVHHTYVGTCPAN